MENNKLNNQFSGLNYLLLNFKKRYNRFEHTALRCPGFIRHNGYRYFTVL
jgi:hypothetical protein